MNCQMVSSLCMVFLSRPYSILCLQFLFGSIIFLITIFYANFLCNPVISLVLQEVEFCIVFVLLRPSLATGENFNVATKISPSETEHCRTLKISPSPAEDYRLLFHIHPRLQTSDDKLIDLFYFDSTKIAVE